MKKHLRWLGACTALLLAVFVMSCDDGPTTVPDGVETTTPTATTETAAPSLDAGVLGVGVWGDCLNEVPGTTSTTRFNNPTCSANDVEIKVLEALSVDYDGPGGDPPVPIPPGGTVTCVEGTTFDVQLRAFFGFNRSETYDIAYFLAEDGGDAKVGDCFHGFLEPIDDGGVGTPTFGPPYSGSYRDAEEGTDPNDMCGDARESDEVTVEGIPGIGAVKDVPETITVTCDDDDDDGFVEIGTCTSWDINASAGSASKPTCEDVDDAFPGTPAKCNCRPAALPVNVQREAQVTVIKDLSPDTDAGTFDLAIFDHNDAMVDSVVAASDDGFAGPYTLTWFRDDEPDDNQASVQEYGANLGSLDETTTPSAFSFYTTTYSCVENNNSQTTVSGSGTGPVNLTLASNDDWVCTFTNTRIAPPAVTVTKTANESFARAWGWTLDKDVFKNGATSGDCSSFDGGSIEGSTQTLQLGQDLRVCYKVTATGTGPTDTNHSVSGTISVSVASSSAPYSGSFNISDKITPGDIVSTDVDCDDQTTGNQNSSLTVAPGGSLSCTYSVSLTKAQADAATTNTATAAVTWNTGDTDSQNGTATVDFSTATPTTETDETADITDIWNGTPVFTIWDDLAASTGANVNVFSRDLSCPDYGDYLIPNDAYLDSNDAGYDLEDDADVTVSCPPPPNGCTLTQGFWRTHSEFGPAPYADGWEAVTGTNACNEPSGSANASGIGADVVFGMDENLAFSIDSDECYYDVMWDPGKGGNMWYKVAHQYIAAWLNVNAGGASVAPIADELAAAADLLAYYDQGGPGTNNKNNIPKQGSDFCDTQVSGPAYNLGCSSGGSFNSDRQFATYLNNRLTRYNEGDLGVPHCDDDAQSLLTSLK